MSSLPYPPPQGMGQIAEVVTGIIGPVAGAGASIYATHEGSKISEKELKQREKEFAAMQELQREQLAAQERAQALAQQASLQQAQIKAYTGTSWMPYVLGGVAVLGLAVAVGMIARRP